jgi:hypothetical protein
VYEQLQEYNVSVLGSHDTGVSERDFPSWYRINPVM